MSTPRFLKTRWPCRFSIPSVRPSHSYSSQCPSKNLSTRCVHYRAFTTTSRHLDQHHKKVQEKGKNVASAEQSDGSKAISKFNLLGLRSSNRPPHSSKNKERSPRRTALLGVLLLTLGSMGVLYIYPSSKRGNKEGIFNAPMFTPFTITNREVISPTAIMLTVRPPQEALGEERDPYEKEWEKGTWSVEIKQPQLQISRSYTPLPPTQTDEPGDIRFLIRREKGGEMSGYLHNLKEGERMWLRGPTVGYDLPEYITDIVFLAGGTGIAPALQMAHTLLERRQDKIQPRIKILWANRLRSECNLDNHIVKILQILHKRHPNALTIQYLVDEENTYINQRQISSALNANAGIKSQPIITKVDEKVVFISGPAGFVNWLAGPKVWDGGEEKQGVVGGVLGRMGRRDWKVWKL